MKLSRRDFIKSIACAIVGFSLTGFEQPETPTPAEQACAKSLEAKPMEVEEKQAAFIAQVLDGRAHIWPAPSEIGKIHFEAKSETCGRCGKKIEEKDAECCWWCTGYLCYECWDEYGHCGHPEAEAQNERARQVAQPAHTGTFTVDNFGGPTDTVEIPVFTKTIATDGTPLIWWHAQVRPLVDDEYVGTEWTGTATASTSERYRIVERIARREAMRV